MSNHEYIRVSEKEPSTLDSKLIRGLRINFSYSMQDLAEKIGTNRGHICRWENGDHDISKLYKYKIVDLFGKRVIKKILGKKFNEWFGK